MLYANKPYSSMVMLITYQILSKSLPEDSVGFKRRNLYAVCKELALQHSNTPALCNGTIYGRSLSGQPLGGSNSSTAGQCCRLPSLRDEKLGSFRQALDAFRTSNSTQYLQQQRNCWVSVTHVPKIPVVYNFIIKNKPKSSPIVCWFIKIIMICL